MSAGSVRLSIKGAVATVLFDRGSVRNAMTFAMYDQLSRACQTIAATSALRAAVFQGVGGAFIAGTDIGEFVAFASGDDGLAYERRIEAGIAEIEHLPVPTLAVIDGPAMGGGLIIATACDLRIASTRSRFGAPIARTLGNCLSIRNMARLERAFGLGATRRMLLLAETLDPSEAHACGFLLGIAESGELQVKAAEMLARLEAGAPLTIAATREAIRRLGAGRSDDADVIAKVYGSADFREGISAFVQKRAPQWSGA